MKALLELIKNRAALLTAALVFDRREPEEGTVIDYHLNVLKARETGEDLADLAPFGQIFPHGFQMGRDRRSLRVVLRICLYQADRDQALIDLDNLATALFPLSFPGWPPWIQEGHTGFFGDEETGQQPHPHYLYTVQMDFVSQQTMRVRDVAAFN
jgi:hypothetical protein